MREEEDGSLTLSVPIADLTEIRRHVLKYGAEVEVLEPQELRRQVREEAARILLRYP
jgi:predicted DNA-binding transcriptional regulator YafY